MTRFSRTDEKAARAKQLRASATTPERRLWLHLRAANLVVSFRRQHPIGPYFTDFYCAQLKLVIELDGGQHIDRARYDEQRTAFLNEQGIEVLRFWNHDVKENVEGVGDAILLAIARRKAELGLR